MILRAIEISGWRCFIGKAEIFFSEGLNILYAPNATGKSTLFEGLLRGLLDGHRVSGQEVEALRPWGRALAPTVTVTFAHGGVDYRMTKRFLDAPSARLERRESGRFIRLAEGGAADQKVREILTCKPPGRGLARPENWGLAQVLWAPQGNLALSNLSGELVADIRASLGAQVSGPAIGPLKERIEERIEATYLQYFTPGGKLKAGREAPAVVQLRENLELAFEKKKVALERQQRFEEATRRVEDFRVRRDQARRDVEAFTKALKEARSQLDEYKAFLSEKREWEERVKSSEAVYYSLLERIEAIKAVWSELKETREISSQLQEDLPLRTREVEAREKEAAKTKSRLEDVRKERRKVDEASQMAEEARRFFDVREKVLGLEARLWQIGQFQKNLVEKKKERTALAAPDEKTLRAIRKAIKERDEFQLLLEAALITLEIVPEKKIVLEIISGEETGGRTLPPGQPAEIKGAPEVVVHLPGLGRLRARGPSGSIEELRNKQDQTSRELNALTEGFGTAELEALEMLGEKARTLDEKVAEAETQIETLLSGDTVEEIEQEQTKILIILGDLVEEHPAWKEHPPNAADLLAISEAIKEAFVLEVEDAELAWESAQMALAAAGEEKARLTTRLEETGKKLEMLESKITDLTSDGKTNEVREGERKKFALSWEAAKAGLEEVTAKLAALGENPSRTVDKLEKQRQSADEAAIKAIENEKTEEGRLETLAAQGPYSALAQADEEVARLKQEIESEEGRIAAIRLLRETVASCRKEALVSITKPVEVAATRTLQRIAGMRLGRMQLSDTFEPGHVVPDLAGASVPLGYLSGGEREQIYLATRLALAELLARDERQLVVLDDVLTATDAGRLARILTILEETAQHLQVLVLTCHPERYRGLDHATFIDLEGSTRDDG